MSHGPGALRRATLAMIVLGACAAASAQAPLRDPMRPYRPGEGESAAEAREPRYVLSAVLISDARRVAVINGKRVHEGERIDGAALMRIGHEGVELRRNGRSIVLTLRTPRRARERPVEREPAGRRATQGERTK